MNIDEFDWLQQWYQSQCDGDWEHEYGINIETIDNPGWHVTINLAGTEQENISFESMNVENGPNNWLFCSVRDNTFDGACDPMKLVEIIRVFKNWVLLTK
ncbi:MAG: hypothetical protein K1000chlam2_00083 [Chlamydiae bacterium]|nr:hypothetical protein [Chlamydiota bacterium]